MEFSRRSFVGFLAGLAGNVVPGGKTGADAAAAMPLPIPTPAPIAPTSVLTNPGATLREALRQRLGDEIYTCWLQTLEIEAVDGRTVTISLPVKFLRNWIQHHWPDELLECCRAEFAGVQYVNLIVRQPGSGRFRERLQRKIDRS